MFYVCIYMLKDFLSIVYTPALPDYLYNICVFCWIFLWLYMLKDFCYQYFIPHHYQIIYISIFLLNFHMALYAKGCLLSIFYPPPLSDYLYNICFFCWIFVCIYMLKDVCYQYFCPPPLPEYLYNFCFSC